MRKQDVKCRARMLLSRETLKQLTTTKLDKIVAGTGGASNHGCPTDACLIRIPAG
jgi:hypothetical protein